MNATIEPKIDSNVSKFRKDKGFFSSFSAIVQDEKGGMFSAVDLRFYSVGRDGMSPVYACVWINGKGQGCTSGGGKASGCGYHKASAAAQAAFESAGVTLSEPIDGRGDTAIEDALKAVCETMGFINTYIHRAHA